MTKFKGHDYTELADAWGIEHPEESFDDDRMLLDEIREYIWDAFDDSMQELDEDVRKDMVSFLWSLFWEATEICYQAPLWFALIDISRQDDFTFVQFFDLLLPEMWT